MLTPIPGDGGKPNGVVGLHEGDPIEGVRSEVQVLGARLDARIDGLEARTAQHIGSAIELVRASNRSTVTWGSIVTSIVATVGTVVAAWLSARGH